MPTNIVPGRSTRQYLRNCWGCACTLRRAGRRRFVSKTSCRVWIRPASICVLPYLIGPNSRARKERPRFTCCWTTKAASHDITVARKFKFQPGTILAMEKGYVDFDWWERLTEQGVYFVTRLKKDLLWDEVEKSDASAELLHPPGPDHSAASFSATKLRDAVAGGDHVGRQKAAGTSVLNQSSAVRRDHHRPYLQRALAD